MEDDRKNTPNSGESKPEMSSSSSSDFEFGSLTPSSPSQNPFSENSLADQLFFNGRLLPHSFPASTTATRSASLTTSENTCRSNSTSSDSSSPTSYIHRTSNASVSKVTSIEHYQNYHKSTLILELKKKPLTNNGKTVNISTRNNNISYLPQCKKKKATDIVMGQLYGSYSRRWQHITPVYKGEWSVKGGIKVGGRKKKSPARRRKKKRMEEERRGISKLMKWWKRILKVVVFACRECHAMEPQILVNEDANYVKIN